MLNQHFLKLDDFFATSKKWVIGKVFVWSVTMLVQLDGV